MKTYPELLLSNEFQYELKTKLDINVYILLNLVNIEVMLTLAYLEEHL